MDQLADMVRRERLRRGLSVRAAASAGGISNTYWARFEDYRQPFNDGISAAVVQAFEWPEDWAVTATSAGTVGSPELRDELQRLFDDLSAGLASLAERVAALERAVGPNEDDRGSGEVVG